MPALIVTVALSKLASDTVSTSVVTMAGLTAVSVSFSVYANEPASTADSTGASFTGVTVTVRVAVVLMASPSLIANAMVRSAATCVPVGSSDELEYVTARSAVCHAACDATPAMLSAPVLALNAAVMPVPVSL